MSYILYDQGKKIGEIKNWSVANLPPVYKNVLGKIVLSTPANDECTFTSPKPLNRRSKLTVVEDGQWELVLELKSLKAATAVVAKIVAKNELQK